VDLKGTQFSVLFSLPFLEVAVFPGRVLVLIRAGNDRELRGRAMRQKGRKVDLSLIYSSKRL
jgi:hypothetical protein